MGAREYHQKNNQVYQLNDTIKSYPFPDSFSMNPIIEELENRKEQAKHILSIIPKKSTFHQQEKSLLGKHQKSPSLKESPEPNQPKAQTQIDFLKKEFEMQKQAAQKKYEQWFEKTHALMLGIDDAFADQFMQTRKAIDLYAKICNGLQEIEKTLQILKKNQDQIVLKRDRLFEEEQKKIENIKWMIEQGENESIEFKSSLRWDYSSNKMNKDLEIPVIKTVAAFLNSKGGTLLIGISDDKKIVGIASEYPTFRKQDGDGFIQYLLQILSQALGSAFNKFIAIRILTLENKEICAVFVEKSDRPVFMRLGNKEEFYIRASNSSQPLSVKEAIEYVQMHFTRGS